MDLIPDFIPVLGYIDDIILLSALVALSIRMIPPDVFDACRQEAKGLWVGGHCCVVVAADRVFAC
ncbi:YkvA family protein [Lacrimispora sp.]|uniref:YkvA family protein n=1 Tax=Lacrimispora sp. TaxID=2719234 RepID=UPI0034609E48